jgi:hypothetical protein
MREMYILKCYPLLNFIKDDGIRDLPLQYFILFSSLLPLPQMKSMFDTCEFTENNHKKYYFKIKLFTC